MKSQTIVLQFAYGPDHQYLLATTYWLHKSLCEKHGYDYRVRTVPVTDRSLYDEQTHMVLEAVQEGYSHVIYFDPDVVWRGQPLIKPPTVYGMTWHDILELGEPHYNNGACYINNDNMQAAGPVLDWWNRPDEGHRYHGQHALNLTLKDNPNLVTRLGHEWNSVEYLPRYRATVPRVSAWHGKRYCCEDIWAAVREVSEASWRDNCPLVPLSRILPNISTREDIAYLMEAIQCKVAVEVGTFRGEFAENLAKHCQRLILIDQWEPYEDPIGDIENMELAERICRERFQNVPNVEIFKARSTFVPHSPVDLVYIDADHSYQAVKEDINTWWEHIRPGGILCGHDYIYDQSWIEVPKAVNEFVAAHQLTLYLSQNDEYKSWFVVKP